MFNRNKEHKRFWRIKLFFIFWLFILFIYTSITKADNSYYTYEEENLRYTIFSVVLIFIPIIIAFLLFFKDNNDDLLMKERIEKEKKLSSEQFIDHISKTIKYFEKLGFTKNTYYNEIFLFVNATSKEWIIHKLYSENYEILNFSDLIEFSIYKDNQAVSSGTVGSAIIGGMLFGAVGAIAGANSQKNVKEQFSSIIIKINLNNINSPLITIPIFKFDQPKFLTPQEKEEYINVMDEFNSYLTYIKRNQ